MSKSVVIVGGGHNGLVAATYLARAGLRVTVLEARPIVGGAAVTEELIPGYRMNSCSFVVGLLRPEIINDLELVAHGLDLYVPPQAISCTIFDDGRSLMSWTEPDRRLREIRDKLGDADLQGYIRFGMDLQALERIIGPTIMNAPPPLSELVRRFEAAGALDLLERLVVGSVRDMADYYFRSDLLKGYITFPGIVSTYGGPSTPGTAYVVSHHCVGEFLGQFGQWGFAKGGMGAISNALARSATAAGAEIRVGAPVEKIVAQGGRATGVLLRNGETLAADIVLSNADPHRTFLGLVGAGNLPELFVERIRAYDMRGSMARVYLAVDELPRFIGFDSSSPGPEHEGHVFLGPSVDTFEAGWDAQRRGEIPERLALELTIDTVRDSSLAPPGKHVIVTGIQQLPFQLRTGSWDQAKPAFTQQVVTRLLDFAPNLKGHIIATHCHTPLDWERRYHLTGGNIFHGGMSLARLFSGRPGGLVNGYGAPLDGLYLCGAGTHPGGGVMGASGFNCAMAVLTDLGLSTPRAWATSASPPTSARHASSLQAALMNGPLGGILARLATTPVSRPLSRLWARTGKK